MEGKRVFYENQANTLIKTLNKRQIDAYYCENSLSAKEKALSLIEENSIVSYGGSQTLNQIGIKKELHKGNYIFLDRDNANSPEASREIHQKTYSADYFLMSTNAITLEGELVNVDGSGNRASALIYGPKHVIIIAGMNKVTLDQEAAIKRIRNFASPPNVNRLSLKTPCSVTGQCDDCLSPDCICCQTVITRFSKIPGRIKVILVGEELGY